MGVAVSQRTEINYAAEQFLCNPHFLENIKSCTPSAREVTRGRGAILCAERILGATCLTQTSNQNGQEHFW